jgi:hypothetical protein
MGSIGCRKENVMILQKLLVFRSVAAVALVFSPVVVHAGEEREDHGYRDGQRYEVRTQAEQAPSPDHVHEIHLERRYETESRVDGRYQPPVYQEPVWIPHPVRTDIRRLRAEAHRRFDDGWHVGVEYRVRFRDGYPAGQYELLLSGFDRGRPVVDDMGRPITASVPLDHPTRTRKTRTYFEGRVSIVVPPDMVWTDDIRIRGEVVDPRTGMILTTDTTRLRIR